MSIADIFLEQLTAEPEPSTDALMMQQAVFEPGGGGGNGSSSGDSGDIPEPPSDPELPPENPPPDSGDGSGNPPPEGPVEGPPVPPDLPPEMPPGEPGDVPVTPPEVPPEVPPGGAPSPIPPSEEPTPPVPPPDAPNHDIPGLSGILDWIRGRIQDIQATISEIITHVTDGIAAIIEGLVPPTIVALTGITGIIGNLVEAFLNQLAPTVEVGQMLQDSLTGGIPLATIGFLEHFWSERGEEINSVLDHLSALDGLPEQYKGLISTARHGTPIALIPVAVGLAIFALNKFLDSALAPELRFVEYQSNRISPNRIPSHPELIEALFRKNIDNDRFSEVLSMHGFGDEARGILIGNRYALIDADRILELWRRGVIDEVAVNNAMFSLGFQGESAEQIKQLAPFLPSPSDLVHFMTRDAFFDTDDGPFGNVVRDFQLDFGESDLPYDWFAKVGVDPQVVKYFWRSHWEIPGRHDANEMFFRGQFGDRSPGGEGERVLERVYRARGIEPRFIGPLISTAYRTIGRIDIRRLIKTGGIDRDGAIEAYQQLGYNPNNAALLADLAIQLATQESASEREPFRSGLKARIVSAYINGTLEQNEAENALTDLGYHEEAINQLITEGEFERHAVLAGHIRQGVERLFTTGEWGNDQARQYLADRGFSDNEIGRLFEWWTPIRELHDLKEEHKQHKEATRSDILNAYHDEVLDRDGAFVHLSALGYADADAEMLLAHVDYQKVKADVTSEIDGIHAAFGDRQIDTKAAIEELDSLNISGRRRDSLIRKWTAELDRRLPELPLNMVEKLALAKLYSFDELTEELRRRHFSGDQIAKFTRLWGYEIEVVAARNTTQSQREADALRRRNEAEARRIEAEQRRQAAHDAAEIRHHEAEQRRHEADAKRAESDARRAARDSRAEHDRLVRDARNGRLSIGRIRTGFGLGILSEDSVRQLMSALGLRPEAIQIEVQILNEQQREKQLTAGGGSSGNSPQPPTTATIA